VVVPGQGGPARINALEDLIEAGSVEGIVHLVANGLAAVRDPDRQRFYAERNITDLDELRVAQSSEEVREFEEVTTSARRSDGRTRRRAG